MAEAPSTASAVPPKKKHQDVETQNLEKMTDYVEETESEELGKVSRRSSSKNYWLTSQCCD